jgi:hypothetical protein
MFWRTVGRWAIVAIAVPVVAWGIRKVSDKMEAKSGQTRFSSLLRQGASGLDTISGRRPAVTSGSR